MITTPAGAATADPGPRPTWLVLTASERGASHIANKAPNQDSVAAERAGPQGMVAAVADGHGHSRHLRSASGSKFAVTIGCQVAQELADRLESAKAEHARQAEQAQEPDSGELAVPAVTPESITAELEEFLVPQVVTRWRDAVLADVAANPFSNAEQGHRAKGDDPTIAYGSTLLLGIAMDDWLILAQIGDGDVVGVQTDGRAIMPVPTDPQLDGLVTTSLCSPDARSDFRVAVVDTIKVPLLAVLLATDGYGNAQVVEQWPSAFSEDLAWMLKQRDAHWLASQLPSWAARCASADGSADDTTVALLVSPVASSDQTMLMPAVEPDKGSEETTIPAMPHSETVPAAVVTAGQESAEPETVRQAAVPAEAASLPDAPADGAAGPGQTTPVDRAAMMPDLPDGPGQTTPMDRVPPAAADQAASDQATSDPVALSDQPTSEWEPPLSAGADGR